MTGIELRMRSIKAFQAHVNLNLLEWKALSQKPLTVARAKLLARDEDFGVYPEDELRATYWYLKQWHGKKTTVKVNVTEDSYWTVRFIDSTHCAMEYYIDGNKTPGPEAIYHIEELRDNDQYKFIKFFLKA